MGKLDKQRAYQLYRAGYLWTEIAAELEVAPVTVRGWAHANGYKANRRESHAHYWTLYIHGLNDQQIAQRLDVLPQNVYGWRQSKGLPSHSMSRVNKEKPPALPEMPKENEEIDHFFSKLVNMVRTAREQGVEPPPGAVAKFMAEWHKTNGGTDYERLEGMM